MTARQPCPAGPASPLSMVAAALIVVAAGAGESTLGQEGRAQEFLEVARKAAAEYEFFRGEAAVDRLTRVEEPTLRWTNPIVGEVYGVDFVWTWKGRPEMAASFFRWYSPQQGIRHEFHSLSPAPLTAKKDGRVIWKISRAGVERKPLPEAPIPAESSAARRIQMRQIARDFSAEKFGDAGDPEIRRELRLMPRPVFSYEAPAVDGIEGMLVAFAQTTDPQVLLILEAVNTPDGARWEYAVARMDQFQAEVRYKDRIVWEQAATPWAAVIDQSRGEPYTKFSLPASN